MTGIDAQAVIGPEAALKLVKAIQELSLARDLDRVMEIARRAARDLTGADGATFILREGDHCHYAEEDAISPLWKGKRFPMELCVSGWVMLHRTPAVIEDIYADSRVLQEAYRPTFVKSLAVVPIRREAPIGAIGNYWATPHRASVAELELLQALADSTSIALENVRVYAELESRVRQRTCELEQANQDLEAFSYSAAHDLRAPVRHILSFSEALVEEGGCNSRGLGLAHRVQRSAERLTRIIDDTLKLARVSRARLGRGQIDLSQTAESVVNAFRGEEPTRNVFVTIAPGLSANGDAGLVRLALENLIGNAWKFTARQAEPRIEMGMQGPEFFVRDNGVGFDMGEAKRLFEPFQRFHTESDFAGTGIGLATVQRIVSKHGGTIRVESAPGKGTAFFFTFG